MDGGAWWAAVHGVTRSRTWLSDFTFTFHFHALEKEMATHSSVLAWRIPGMGEPGGLPSMGSHRLGHDWSDLAAAAARLVLQGASDKDEDKEQAIRLGHVKQVKSNRWQTKFWNVKSWKEILQERQEWVVRRMSQKQNAELRCTTEVL